MGIKHNKDRNFRGVAHELKKEKLERKYKNHLWELEDQELKKEIQRIDSDIDMRIELERQDINWVNNEYDGVDND